MTIPPRVLFVTLSEHGQANIALAVAHELLMRGDVDVHLSSFPALEPRVHEVQSTAQGASDGVVPTIHFHPLEGPSMTEAVGPMHVALKEMQHEPGFMGVWRVCAKLKRVFICWTPADYLKIAKSIVTVCHRVSPDLVVVDSGFYPAIDAMKMAEADWMILSPNSLKDLAGPLQPKAAALWKYPPVGTGWGYPLRWWQIPMNLTLQTRMMIKLLLAPEAKALQKAREAAGIKGLLPLAETHNVPVILPCNAEMDYRMHIPDHIHPCGPILFPSGPLEMSDPELNAWVMKGPLVFINCGSLMRFSDAKARRLAKAIRTFRNQRQEVRILWKLSPEEDVDEHTLELLKEDIDSDMTRIVSWLKPHPVAILQTGNVIGFVNHGGANSWYEGASTGVPQLLLPGWLDCYDWAVRSEYLGTGIWGSRRGGLDLDVEELGKGLLDLCEEPRNDSGADYSRACQKRNLRIAAQELGAKVGQSGTAKAGNFIVDHAKACREKRQVRIDS